MKLRESPRDRLKEVTLGLISDQSGPNVLLGAAVTASLQSVTGLTPWWWGAITTAAWAASVVAYAVADEVKAAIEEQKKKVLSDESDYYGIE